MFTRRELEANADYIARKKKNVLDSKEGTDLDYLKNLQTLIKLENAVDKELEGGEYK